MPDVYLDPDAQHHEWVRSFTWHLDIVPPLIEAIIWSTMPSIKASQTDKVVVSGGGFIDNMTTALAAFDQSADGRGIAPSAAVADAELLWWSFVDYARAVTAWLNANVLAPWAPMLPPLSAQQWSAKPKPDADPLSARGEALVVVGWLVDHADRIYALDDLEESADSMFAEIRRLRGRYGVHPRPRAQMELCGTCGERQVGFAWVSNPNGSPKPIRVGRCRRCGETYEVAPTPIAVEPAVVLSETCEDAAHDRCESVHCECSCHQREAKAA